MKEKTNITKFLLKLTTVSTVTLLGLTTLSGSLSVVKVYADSTPVGDPAVKEWVDKREAQRSTVVKRYDEKAWNMGYYLVDPGISKDVMNAYQNMNGRRDDFFELYSQPKPDQGALNTTFYNYYQRIPEFNSQIDRITDQNRVTMNYQAVVNESSSFPHDPNPTYQLKGGNAWNPQNNAILQYNGYYHRNASGDPKDNNYVPEVTIKPKFEVWNAQFGPNTESILNSEMGLGVNHTDNVQYGTSNYWYNYYSLGIVNDNWKTKWKPGQYSKKFETPIQLQLKNGYNSPDYDPNHMPKGTLAVNLTRQNAAPTGLNINLNGTTGYTGLDSDKKVVIGENGTTAVPGLNQKIVAGSNINLTIAGYDKEDRASGVNKNATRIAITGSSNINYVVGKASNSHNLQLQIMGINEVNGQKPKLTVSVTDADGLSTTFPIEFNVVDAADSGVAYGGYENGGVIEGNSLHLPLSMWKNRKLVTPTRVVAYPAAIGNSFPDLSKYGFKINKLDDGFALSTTQAKLADGEDFVTQDASKEPVNSLAKLFRFRVYGADTDGFKNGGPVTVYSNVRIYKRLTAETSDVTLNNHADAGNQQVVKGNLPYGVTVVAKPVSDSYGLSIDSNGYLTGTANVTDWKPGEFSRVVTFNVQVKGDASTLNQTVTKKVKVTIKPTELVAQLNDMSVIDGHSIPSQAINVVGDPQNVTVTDKTNYGRLAGKLNVNGVTLSGTPKVKQWNGKESKYVLPLAFDLENKAGLKGNVNANLTIYRELAVNTTNPVIKEGTTVREPVVEPNVDGAKIEASSANNYGLSIDSQGNLVSNGPVAVNDWGNTEEKQVTFNVKVKGEGNQTQTKTVTVTIKKNLDKDGDFIPDVDDADPKTPYASDWGLTRVPSKLTFSTTKLDNTVSNYEINLKDEPTANILQAVDKTNAGSWDVQAKFELLDKNQKPVVGSYISADYSADVFEGETYKSRNQTGKHTFNGTPSKVVSGQHSSSATYRYSNFKLVVPQSDNLRPTQYTSEITWTMTKAPQ